jgi:2-polyprenyl-3-methyl-5-hydroxy-6-metoxy-1,4-benzoquinol methylase
MYSIGVGNTLDSNYRDKIDKFSSHSLIVKELGKFNLSKNKVLDIGCHTGVLLSRIRQATDDSNSFYGADLDDNLEKEFGFIDFIKCDLNEKELDKVFKNNSFDVVILADILEHLVDPWESLLNVKKILNPDAKIVVSLPNSGHWFFRLKVLFGQIDYKSNGLFDRTHLRFFTKKTAKELILNGGFAVKKLNYSSLPWENLLKSRFLTRSLSVVERALILVRPQFFAYQFIFIITSGDDLK